MLPSRQLYARQENSEKGMFPVTLESAKSLNEHDYGIHWTVNEFDGARRIENVTRILSWFIEFDGGNKLEQWKKLEASPIIPSLVIETKNGYHVYFDAIDGTPNNYRVIVERLIYFFGSDPVPKDITRCGRVPGFYHKKDPSNPFLVIVKFQSEFKYRERIMLHYFPEVPKKDPLVTFEKRTIALNNDLSKFLDELDHEYALQALSGHWSVKGEKYSFTRVGRGRKNILVDGKSTSCFIDEKGRIGATGGPNVFTWLRYFGHSDAKIYEILKEVYGYGKQSE